MMNWWRALFLAMVFPSAAFALDVPSELLAPGEKVNFDGLLGEWRDLAGASLEVVERSSYKGADDFSVTVKSFHDKDKLYLAITAVDDTFLRSGAGTVGEDRVELWFGGKAPLRVSVLPDNLKGIAQELKVNGKVVKPGRGGVEALESYSTKENAWMLEVSIPWGALSEDARPWERIPFCVAAFDGDKKGKLDAVAASCELRKGEPLRLGALVKNEEVILLDALLAQLGRGREEISNEFYADVAGDSAVDRVLVVGTSVAVVGLGLGANHFTHYGLDLKSPADIKEVSLLDVDGDGKQNLIVSAVEYDNSGARSQDIVRVFSMQGELYKPFFGHEIAGAQREGSMRSVIEWKKAKKGYELNISQAQTGDLSATTYVDFDAKVSDKDYQEILLPWGTTKKATYRFVSGRAELVTK
jgi:Carbohydrate family 9 binding domain-like